MVTAIILTEREVTDLDPNPPKVPGRIITTLEKAKEIRPLVEKCITIAKKGLIADQKAVEFATTAEKGSEEWKKWRASEQWQKWAAARSPGVMARRKIFSIVKDRDAVKILFDRIAPRFTDRPGGYTASCDWPPHDWVTTAHEQF